MQLIVGLGNPGKEYENNRHNVGCLVIDQITKNQKLNPMPTGRQVKSQNDNLKLKILKPLSYMNNSGGEVKKEADYYKIEPNDIFVVHDDMDIDFGTLRTSFGSSSAGHNGVQSIIDALGTNEFWRIRVGIGRPAENVPSEKFVLQDFNDGEKEKINTIIAKTAGNVLEWISHPKEETIQLL